MKKILLILIVVFGLLFTGCPSPLNQQRLTEQELTAREAEDAVKEAVNFPDAVQAFQPYLEAFNLAIEVYRTTGNIQELLSAFDIFKPHYDAFKDATAINKDINTEVSAELGEEEKIEKAMSAIDETTARKEMLRNYFKNEHLEKYINDFRSDIDTFVEAIDDHKAIVTTHITYQEGKDADALYEESKNAFKEGYRVFLSAAERWVRDSKDRMNERRELRRKKEAAEELRQKSDDFHALSDDLREEAYSIRETIAPEQSLIALFEAMEKVELENMGMFSSGSRKGEEKKPRKHVLYRGRKYFEHIAPIDKDAILELDRAIEDYKAVYDAYASVETKRLNLRSQYPDFKLLNPRNQYPYFKFETADIWYYFVNKNLLEIYDVVVRFEEMRSLSFNNPKHYYRRATSFGNNDDPHYLRRAGITCMMRSDMWEKITSILNTYLKEQGVTRHTGEEPQGHIITRWHTEYECFRDNCPALEGYTP